MRKKSSSALLRIDRRKVAILMAERDLNNRKLAKLAGVSPQAIGQLRHWGGGSRDATIGRIAAALGVNPAEILADEPYGDTGERAREA